jgi:DNA-directed RNA polymerase subunit M/transcription elongation factor TFIIS
MIQPIMEALDPAAEWLRLSEHYRRMSDQELLALARRNSELTEAAQQILANEISARRLKLQPEELPAAPNPEPPADSSSSLYDQDRALVEICTVWSLSDALQLQTLLDRAGIPFYMGPENATGVDAVTSNFSNGVSVKIMRIGLPWAGQAMKNYEPANEPVTQQEEAGELLVRCPKCNSTEVVFERLINQPATAASDSSPKFVWTCDACGHHWDDEGIAEEENH